MDSVAWSEQSDKLLVLTHTRLGDLGPSDGTESDSYGDRWYTGQLWRHFESAWRQSPLAYAQHAKTPFMLLQDQSDTRGSSATLQCLTALKGATEVAGRGSPDGEGQRTYTPGPARGGRLSATTN
jgi:hypothetical protein